MKLLMPLLATLVLSQTAMAGSASTFKLLGFSKSNNTVAFAQSSIGDGSGYGAASITVIDVKANTVLKTVSAVDERDSSTEESALKLAMAKINLKSYGVKVGESLGKTLLQRLPTDHSKSTDSVFSMDSWAEGGATSVVPKYELSLSTKSIATDNCLEEDTKLMKLTLTNKEGDATPVNLVMQEDSKLPTSRGCALGYGVSQVITSGDALVVVVKYSSVGFEGPDTGFIAVTSQIKLK